MTDFEFLSVLIFIVIGFGLTHLLAGLGRAFYFRDQNRIDAGVSTAASRLDVAVSATEYATSPRAR